MADVRLIDAVALIADGRICGNCKDFECCDGNVAFCESARVRRAINEAPTVEAEPVTHGEWRVIGYTALYCTECNVGIPVTLVDGFSYCPYCGARMDGKELSE